LSTTICSLYIFITNRAKATEMTRKNMTSANDAPSRPALFIIVSLIANVGDAVAADLTFPQPEPAVAPANAVVDYFATWYDRVDAAQASQPRWMTLITTVTPRLEEEYRYDQFQQFLGKRVSPMGTSSPSNSGSSAPCGCRFEHRKTATATHAVADKPASRAAL
jgi:hypothetical protein